MIGALAGLCLAGSAYAAAPSGTFAGNAYGTNSSLTVGPLAASLAGSAFIPCSCLGTDGETMTNRVERLAAGAGGSVLRASTILTSVYTTETATAAIVRNTARIERLNALNGLITADSILAVAITNAGNGRVTSTDEGSTFANLKIAGRPIAANVAPNTHVPLPGIGEVILKREGFAGNGTASRAIQVEMIYISVTSANSFGLPVGSNVVVAHAVSGFTATPVGAVSLTGRAWAASANAAAGDLLTNSIGKTANLAIPCQGTSGATLTSKAGAVTVGSVLSFGGGVTTAFGNGGVAKTTSTLQSVNLLGGLISASSVKAVAQTAIANGVRSRSTSGSGFVGLRVLGVAVANDVAANTKIALPGIGYVIVNQQVVPSATSAAETQVLGLHVYVTATNVLGLPVGAEIIAAYASAGAVAPKPGV